MTVSNLSSYNKEVSKNHGKLSPTVHNSSCFSSEPVWYLGHSFMETVSDILVQDILCYLAIITNLISTYIKSPRHFDNLSIPWLLQACIITHVSIIWYASIQQPMVLTLWIQDNVKTFINNYGMSYFSVTSPTSSCVFSCCTSMS